MKKLFGSEQVAVGKLQVASNSWLTAKGKKLMAVAFFLPLVSCGGGPDTETPSPRDAQTETSQGNGSKPSDKIPSNTDRNCTWQEIAEESAVVALEETVSLFINERNGVARVTVELIAVGRTLGPQYDPEDKTESIGFHGVGYSEGGMRVDEVDQTANRNGESGNVRLTDLSDRPIEQALIMLLDAIASDGYYYDKAQIAVQHRALICNGD